MKSLAWILLVSLPLVACNTDNDDSTSCTDECIYGDMECFQNDIRECGHYDSDECLDWRIIPCTPSEICLDLTCQNIEELSTATIELSITDKCNDGYYIEYKYFDVDHYLVWPDADSHFITEYYDQEYTSGLSCIPNTKICYGGNTGDIYWGLSIDGDQSCESCCVSCIDGDSFGWNLTCG